MGAAPKYPAAFPTLDELARDPLRASGLAADALAALAARCAAVQSALAAAQFALVVNGGTADAPAPHDDDRLLGIKEAAAKLGVTRDYLYRRKDLPFRVSVAPGQVRFSLKGIEKFIRAKTVKGDGKAGFH
jgi:predicted DNA-binding transcriptional regulator AlpA